MTDLFDVLFTRDLRITREKIEECLRYVAMTFRLDRDVVSKMIVDRLNKCNYKHVAPSAWFMQSPSRKELVAAFITDVDRLIPLNIFPRKRNGALRVMTYNVHYWTSLSNRLNFDDVKTIARIIDPDIMCLQEAVLPESALKTSSTNNDLATSENFGDHDFLNFDFNFQDSCKTTASHAGDNAFFGNVTFSKAQSRSTLLPFVAAKQDRCSIFSAIDGILIVNIHLDAFDETGKTRRKQLRSVLDNVPSTGPVIILGDFNALNVRDYSLEEIKWLKQRNDIDFKTIELMFAAGFVDAFVGCKYTVWSGRRVDYVFTRGLKAVPNVYYSAHSDHFPLFVTIDR